MAGPPRRDLFVFERSVLKYLHHCRTLEREPLARLARDQQLAVHGHHGFWCAMDTLRERAVAPRSDGPDAARVGIAVRSIAAESYAECASSVSSPRPVLT